MAPITDEVRQQRKLPATGGVLIMGVVPGSSAEGVLKEGDVLVSLAGKPVAATQDVGAVVTGLNPGDKFEAVVLRDGKEQKLSLTMKEKPRDKGANYEVLYDHVVSHGARIRTIISKPTHVSAKRPVMFLIQGIGYVSQDTPLDGPGGYNRILKAFNDKGFVTVRVDKPGLGDSEGGPAQSVDYERDVDGFRQALKSLPKYDFIDQDNIFIFGHSMGGCHGPILATEFKLKGLAVAGTVTRTWYEYMLQNSRRQAILAGVPYSAVDQATRGRLSALHLIFEEGLEPAQVKEKRPEFAAGVDGLIAPNNTISGIPLPFWRQLFKYNLADYWQKVDTNVLALWGENEFIASYEDHPLIAEIVNKNHPGKARYEILPNSDHGFFKTTSIEDSFRRWTQPGKEFNPNVIDSLVKWVDEVMSK